VVQTTVHLEGETAEGADVLTYNGNGELVASETLGVSHVADRVFAKYDIRTGWHIRTGWRWGESQCLRIAQPGRARAPAEPGG
jgi:hypothetical protein